MIALEEAYAVDRDGVAELKRPTVWDAVADNLTSPPRFSGTRGGGEAGVGNRRRG